MADSQSSTERGSPIPSHNDEESGPEMSETDEQCYIPELVEPEEEFYSEYGLGGGWGSCGDDWTPLDRAISRADLDEITEACRKYGFDRKRNYYMGLELPPIIALTGHHSGPEQNTLAIFNSVLDVLVEEGYELNTPVVVQTEKPGYCYEVPKQYRQFETINVLSFIICEPKEYSEILLQALLDRGLKVDQEQIAKILAYKDDWGVELGVRIRKRWAQFPDVFSIA